MRHEEYSSVRARFVPERQAVLSWSDQSVCLWDAATGEPLVNPMVSDTPVQGASYLTESQAIVSWGENAIQLWNSQTAEKMGDPATHDYPISGVEYIPEQNALLTSDRGGTAYMRNAANLRRRYGFRFEGEKLEQVSSLPKEGALLTRDDSRELGLRDIQEGKFLTSSWKVQHVFSITGEQYVEGLDGLLTWGYYEETARLWKIRPESLLKRSRIDNFGELLGMSSRKDGAAFFTWDRTGTVRLWNAQDGGPMGEASRKAEYFLVEYDEHQNAFLTWSNGGGARLWSAEDGKPLGPPLAEEGTLFFVHYVPGKSVVLTSRLRDYSSQEIDIQLWDATDGSEQSVPVKHKSGFQGNYLPDQDQILTWGQDGYVRLWDAASGNLVHEFSVSEGESVSATYAEELDMIVTCASDEIVFWDRVTGEERSKWEPGPADDLSPARVDYIQEHKVFLASSLAGDFLLDSAGTMLGAPMQHPEFTLDREYIPQLDAILTWGEDGTARLWSIRDGSPMGRHMRHVDGVYAEGLIGGSKMGAGYQEELDVFVTWGHGLMRLWSTKDYKVICTLPHHAKFRPIVALENSRLRLTTVIEDGQAIQDWLFETEMGASVGESILEFEVRSGSTLSANGVLDILSAPEVVAKRRDLEKLRTEGNRRSWDLLEVFAEP